MKLLDIPLQYTYQDISELLKPFGTIISVKRQARTDVPTGYAFVYFAQPASARMLLQYSALVYHFYLTFRNLLS